MTTTTKPPSPRTLTDAEVRAASAMFWSATQFARMTVARWNLRKRQPTKAEMTRLAMDLRAAEEAALKISSGPPSDGHSVDNLINYFEERISTLAAKEPAL
jgi:hypothetical protein